VLKAGFRKCHRQPQHRLPLGCELRELLVAASASDKPRSWEHHPPAGSILIFTRGWVEPRAIVRSERNMSLKSDTTGNRSRDRATSSAASWPLRHPRPHHVSMDTFYSRVTFCKNWTNPLWELKSSIASHHIIYSLGLFVITFYISCLALLCL